MTAIRSKAIGYINELPEERLASALDYLQYLSEQKHPLQISGREELYRFVNEGLDDINNNRVEPLEDVMREVHELINQYDV